MNDYKSIDVKLPKDELIEKTNIHNISNSLTYAITKNEVSTLYFSKPIADYPKVKTIFKYIGQDSDNQLFLYELEIPLIEFVEYIPLIFVGFINSKDVKLFINIGETPIQTNTYSILYALAFLVNNWIAKTRKNIGITKGSVNIGSFKDISLLFNSDLVNYSEKPDNTSSNKFLVPGNYYLIGKKHDVIQLQRDLRYTLLYNPLTFQENIGKYTSINIKESKEGKYKAFFTYSIGELNNIANPIEIIPVNISHEDVKDIFKLNGLENIVPNENRDPSLKNKRAFTVEQLRSNSDKEYSSLQLLGNVEILNQKKPINLDNKPKLVLLYLLFYPNKNLSEILNNLNIKSEKTFLNYLGKIENALDPFGKIGVGNRIINRSPYSINIDLKTDLHTFNQLKESKQPENLIKALELIKSEPLNIKNIETVKPLSKIKENIEYEIILAAKSLSNMINQENEQLIIEALKNINSKVPELESIKQLIEHLEN